MADSVLIPRYPGAKSNRAKYPVWDGATYDSAIVPFAGSGRWCIPALQRGYVRALRVADADPAVRAVWGEFARQERNTGLLSKCIEAWVVDFLRSPNVSSQKLLESNARELFDRLCSIHDDPECSIESFDYVAVKILLHKLCFGGNVRSNAQGKLNISLRTDWESALTDWCYELPWCPPNRTIDIYADWSDCFEKPIQGKTIAFIDPPYYAPGNGPRVKGGMSKAYAVHGGNPNNRSVLELFTGAVQAAVDAGCDRIVATNYWGHWLQTVKYEAASKKTCYARVIDSQWVEHAETTDFMRGLGFKWFQDLGPLQSMNNINFKASKAGTTEQRTVQHEGWWELGGTRQHGRVEQLDLLGAIAA